MLQDKMSDDGITSDFEDLSIADSGRLEKLRNDYEALLGEVDAFIELAKSRSRQIELRHYRNDISHDLGVVKKVRSKIMPWLS
jgi:hypothetical protein